MGAHRKQSFVFVLLRFTLKNFRFCNYFGREREELLWLWWSICYKKLITLFVQVLKKCVIISVTLLICKQTAHIDFVYLICPVITVTKLTSMVLQWKITCSSFCRTSKARLTLRRISQLYLWILYFSEMLEELMVRLLRLVSYTSSYILLIHSKIIASIFFLEYEKNIGLRCSASPGQMSKFWFREYSESYTECTSHTRREGLK